MFLFSIFSFEVKVMGTGCQFLSSAPSSFSARYLPVLFLNFFVSLLVFCFVLLPVPGSFGFLPGFLSIYLLIGDRNWFCLQLVPHCQFWISTPGSSGHFVFFTWYFKFSFLIPVSFGGSGHDVSSPIVFLFPLFCC